MILLTFLEPRRRLYRQVNVSNFGVVTTQCEYDVYRIILKFALLLWYIPASGFKLGAEYETLHCFERVDCVTHCVLKPERQRPSAFGGGENKTKQKQTKQNKNRSLG